MLSTMAVQQIHKKRTCELKPIILDCSSEMIEESGELFSCFDILIFSAFIDFTENSSKDTLEQVMAEALCKSGSTWSSVRAVCLGVSGVNHPKDQERILNWLRYSIVKLFWQFFFMLYRYILIFWYTSVSYNGNWKFPP